MRALLILFMIAPLRQAGLAFPVAKAGAIYGLYTAMVYLLSLPGGWLADQFLGQRRAVLYGGILIASGHFCLAIPTLSAFYGGLTIIVLGTGLLKPNVSTMVGQLYKEHDHRRDAGFSIFYMGINVGALVAPLICGYLGEKVNWHYGFATAGIGMTIGLLQYVLRGKNLGRIGLHPVPKDPKTAAVHSRVLKGGIVAASGTALLVFVLDRIGLLKMSPERVASAGGVMLVVITIAFFAWVFLFGNWSPLERKRLLAVLVLFVAAAAFWANYEQAGSTLNLFAKRNTRLALLGFSYPASWFQSLNSLFILMLAPFFAWLWIKLGSKDPSSPAKFAGGLLFVALGFLVLVPVSGSGARVSPIWLILCYFLQTIGELLLSPVGLSAMTKLAPPRIASLTMGAWFLADSVGNYIGGLWASAYETFPLPMLFGLVGGVSLLVGALLLVFLRPIKNLMSGAD